METKGVASVRSPVNNLQQYTSSVSHEAFVDAVVKAFREEYDIQDKVCHSVRFYRYQLTLQQVNYVEETAQTTAIPSIREGMEELPVSGVRVD